MSCLPMSPLSMAETSGLGRLVVKNAVPYPRVQVLNPVPTCYDVGDSLGNVVERQFLLGWMSHDYVAWSLFKVSLKV